MGRRAVISVSDKQGIVEFARGLVELGFDLVSTGGTYKTLVEAEVPVKYISEVTGFPEILDGRVKTLHPKIHGGILARRSIEHLAQMEKNGIEYIDLVAVNLYPFRETISKPGVSLEEAVENIDIGGPSMVRSAAKNHERVTVVVNPQHYGEILDLLREKGQIPAGVRQRLAAEAFAHTAEYDRLIADYLESRLEEKGGFPSVLRLTAKKVQDLRYGENPQQKAAFYSSNGSGTLAGGKQLQGKELSYNNWMDMDAAWKTVLEFQEAAAVIIKHTNPCGIALGGTPLAAYERALASDPVSAFGGIAAFNRVVDEPVAAALKERFYEVVIAPEFSPEARDILKEKVNLRLWAVGRGEAQSKPGWKIRSVDGGYLVQEEDEGTVPASAWEVVTKARPSEADLKELEFAWQAVKHVKSNAIVVGREGQTLGVGAGQMNRVGSVRIALTQAGSRAEGAYLASDAFFFTDTVEEAAKAGLRALVQPGGSVQDQAVIEAADRLNLIMLFTRRRHFQH
ncbi:bifunctional purine biosynthesis protein PurH [Peptococcaceae bacterium CEB3]|nr:bifunctional purine biosynthesis protein PurH [Peptococcaceae bacterium CEB3]